MPRLLLELHTLELRNDMLRRRLEEAARQT